MASGTFRAANIGVRLRVERHKENEGDYNRSEMGKPAPGKRGRSGTFWNQPSMAEC